MLNHQVEPARTLSRSGPLGFILTNRWGVRPIIAIALVWASDRLVKKMLGGLANPVQHSGTTDTLLLSPVLITEFCRLAGLILVFTLFSYIQKEPIGAWGYRDAKALKRLCWGLFFGFLFMSTLVLSLWGAHLLIFLPSAFSLVETLRLGTLWALMFLLVGIFEESQCRGYLQYVLTRNIGFWWTGALMALYFMYAHWTNQGENMIGLITVGAFSLVACYSLWLTGSLWWAIGFHAAWDWTQSYFYGAANSGVVFEGHFLAVQPAGSDFWNGRMAGPEGTPLMLLWLLLSAIAMYLYWGRRTKRPLATVTSI
ncbi:CPBP family intramembrane glutamic endopeptidase [Undibacterium sp. TJN25]|uniref:CPBP family intramembrane glutamic endopeptidase n=1 Tax=Undibacterium sp. TJN25 TaxID=3413056 RepID=UPI003BF448AD